MNPALLPAGQFSGEGGMRKGMDTERKKHRESSLFVFLCSFSLVCLWACIHTCIDAVLIVILYACIRFQMLASVVMSQHGLQCISTVNIYSVHSEYTATLPCLQRGFLASSQALSPSTLVQPQWLIPTQAAVVSNQHSSP